MTDLLVRLAVPAEFPAIARLTVAAYQAGGQLDGEHGYARTLTDVAGRAQDGELLVAVDPAHRRGGRVGGVRAARHPVRRTLRPPVRRSSGCSRWIRRPRAGASARRWPGPAWPGRSSWAWPRVVICTRDFALAAQRLYARLGFVRTPERDWSPAPGVDLLALRLDLAPATAPVIAA